MKSIALVAFGLLTRRVRPNSCYGFGSVLGQASTILTEDTSIATSQKIADTDKNYLSSIIFDFESEKQLV
jgi:hypothetical protein